MRPSEQIITLLGRVGPPSWVIPGLDIDMNFLTGQYYGGNLSDLLSVTRAAPATTYAENSAGLLVPFTANTLRLTNKGLLVEEARTNIVFWNRDLTNAVWTKSNITVAKDQTGADGTANAASSITAASANGTVLQSITFASSSRLQSAYMKRLVGTGNVDMTTDGGTTWTTVSGSINSAGYTSVVIPAQTLANPTVGFRIVTSGDSIAVDFVQNETGALRTSPVANTSGATTRSADNMIAAGALRSALLGSAASFLFIGGGTLQTGTAMSMLIGNGGSGTSATLISSNSTTTIRSVQNSVTLGATFGSGTSTGVTKAALGWDASGRSLVGNDGTVGSDSQVVLGNTGNINIGWHPGNLTGYDGFIQRIGAARTRKSNTILKGWTAADVLQPLVTVDGNSLAKGNINGVTPWSATLATNLGTWFVSNYSVVAATTEQRILGETAAQADYRLNRPKNIAVLWEITNSLYFGDDAATAYAAYRQWCLDWKAAGFKVVAVTALPRNDGVPQPAMENSRQTANALVVANWPTFADALLDIGSDATIGVYGSELNTTYYQADKVHLTSAGNAYFESQIRPVVLSL